MPGGHQHNAGNLKQVNKKHKNNKSTKSKRTVKLAQGGKVQRPSITGNKGTSDDGSIGRLSRQNQAHQLRRSKKLDVILQKRLGSTHGPPRTIALVPITWAASSEEFWGAVGTQTTAITKSQPTSLLTYVAFPNLKAKCLIVESRSRNMEELLDICKGADLVLLLSKESMGDGSLIDEAGASFLSSLRSVGSPELACIIQRNSAIIGSIADPKAQNESRMALQKYLQSNYQSECKVFDDSHPALFCRHITSCAIRQISWRSHRSYMLSDMGTMALTKDQTNPSGPALLTMSGYLRGRPLFVNSLMHIEHVGTCRIVKVEAAADPFAKHRHAAAQQAPASAFADPNEQDSLVLAAAPDHVAGEQTWPTEDEMGSTAENVSAAAGLSGAKMRVETAHRIPAGMSTYQADWLVDEEGEWKEEEGEEEDEDDGEEAEDDEDEVESGHEAAAAARANEDEEDDEEEDDDMSFADSTTQAGGSAKAAFSRNRSKQQVADDDLEFPDEVDTPEDVPARERFARYRALQSFRSSPWHPKENLPLDYSTIYQFENFVGAQKRILDRSAFSEQMQHDMVLTTMQNGRGKHKGDGSVDMSDGGASVSADPVESGLVVAGAEDHICSDQFVSISLEIPPEFERSLGALRDLRGLTHCNVFSLHTHENKLSVLHFKIQRISDYAEPIKSKDELIFEVGFRTFKARPIFSEANLNSDKHRFERFLRHGQFSVASCYGPITFSPCSVMVYKELPSGGRVLVATGGLLNVDPDRIVLKRIILTGNPIRVRKKFGVVKHMLYDPMDVRWFKPAEITTKYGLRGHITESVGTHGLFKAQFNAPIKQNDTVMLVLYKRVFPKFAAEGVVIT